MSTFIRLESAVTLKAMVDVLRETFTWLGEDELTRAFLDWAVRVLIPLNFPDVEWGQIEDLMEGLTMLAERAKQWTEDWFAEGRESGLKEGFEQGRVIGLTQGFEQAQRQMLLRQARLKFDDRTAEQLSEVLNLTALPAALREVGDGVIECSSGLKVLIRALGEQGKHWKEEWIAGGRRSGLQEGLEKGRDQGLRLGLEKGRRDLAVRQTRLKFGDAAAERLLPLLDRVPTAAILAEVGDWVIQCGDAAELLARVENAASSGNGQKTA